MRFLISFLLIILTFNSFSQNQLAGFKGIELEIQKRDFVNSLSEEIIVQGENYLSLIGGGNINLPKKIKDNFYLIGNIGYSRSFPKEWSFLDDNRQIIKQEIKADMFSVKSGIAFYVSRVGLQLDGGLHMERMWIESKNLYSRINPGYGLFVSINLSKDKGVFIPIIGAYKIRGSSVFWSLKLPVYIFKD